MTKEYQTEAVVISSKDVGSRDKIITLFSKEYGKITGIAYGVRSSKKKQSGTLQQFAYLDVSLKGPKSTDLLDIITDWDLVKSFHKLGEDLTILSYANLFCELTKEFCPEKQADPEIFELILETLELLLIRNPRIVVLSSAHQLISRVGFEPILDYCVHCDRQITTDSYFFDNEAGGVVCESCKQGNLPVFNKEIKNLIKQLEKFYEEKTYLEDSFSFSVNARVLEETEKIVFDYIKSHIERPLKTLDFIQEIRAM
ncbi:DNA repair protein RecO [Selenomonadales bacterium OttesenSCG-928-I06]|nr:DNA repair protein RecO [Selenomonadales bacterium OttesenSCG-928-I06]